MSKFALPTVVAFVVCGVPALGATVTWTGLGPDDNWNTSANWSNPPGNPPTFSDDAIVGAPAPAVVNVNGIVLTLAVDASGEIDMLGGNDLLIQGGALSNFGEIVVNSDQADALSTIVFNAATTISGDGKVVLNKPFTPGSPPFTFDKGATIESAYQINHGASHTIEGTGQINATLLNEGTVRAMNPAGAAILKLILGTNQQFNENLFASSASGTLQIESTLITQGKLGRILADTGGVTLNGTKIIGGTIESLSGGVFSVVGSSGARLRDVLNEATVNAGVFLGIEGSGFTNNGTINGGTIRFDDTMTLDGTGEIVLSNGNLQTLSTAVLTQDVDHSIRGKGTLSAELINNGVIEASPPAGSPTPILTLSGGPKTNNHIIRALAGTVVDVASSQTIDQDPGNGRLIAQDGVVQFNTGTSLNGGRVEATGAGRVEVRGTVTFTDVTVEGALNVRAQPTVTLTVEGSTLTNNGLVTVNPQLANTHHTILFDGATSMSLAGNGVIDLNHDAYRAKITVATGKTLTHEVGHKITGNGEINGSLVNLGVIEGDSSSNLIDINGTLSGTNTLKNVRINGTHSIGLGSVYAVQTLGTYELADTATLEVEIGGTNLNLFDSMTGQTVTIDGTLEIEQIDPGGGVFQPQLGDTFEIVNATSVTGMFDSVNITGLNPALTYQVLYAANSVTLEAVRKYSADFDFDGDVDDADRATWEVGFGTSSGAVHMNGDADEDGDIDAFDYLAWQQQVGSGLGPLVAAAAVPEPSALTLLSSLALAGLLSRRRHP
ncbi:MAG: hypothetical protein KDA57_12640 [Planctomycetales bacterium]|nr:hypothetical protein [Planctomycetales bacterium]